MVMQVAYKVHIPCWLGNLIWCQLQTKYQKGEHLLFSPVSMGGNSISIYLVRIQLWVLQHYVQYLINQDLSMRDFFLMSVNIDRKGSMRTKWSFEGNPLFFKIISKGLLLCCAVFSCLAVSNSLWPQRACQASPSLGILQARMLDWVAILSRGSSQPRDQRCICCIGRLILYHWATWRFG